MRHRKDLGARRHERIEYRRPGVIIPAPDAPWLECFILDISDSGICLEVGALAISKVFGIAFNATGSVVRVCFIAWWRGELIGASFITARQLREREKRNDYVDPRLHKSATI